MSDNLFCQGQTITTPQYQDGWYRTFKGHPDMNKPVLDMIKEWIDEGEYGRILIFFTGECGFDNDYSEFLLREFIGGSI